MENNEYQINNLISAYRKANTLTKLGQPEIVGPTIKKYRNKFVDGMIREKVPIHVQASKELSPIENNNFYYLNTEINTKYSGPTGAGAIKDSSKFSGTRVIGEETKTQFRIRPQTPKLDMILLKKTKRNKLSKIEQAPKTTKELTHSTKVVEKIKTKSLKIKQINKEVLDAASGNNSNNFVCSPEHRNLDSNDPRKSLTTLPKRKLKLKKQHTNNENSNTKSKQEEETKDEVVHTQQNFYVEKLVEQEEEEIKVNEADTDDELYFKPKSEAGILFGAAYENKYIDILENSEIENDMEINEKMLEISLGMNKEELMKLKKIEIKVDTTNTHMQFVGEMLQSLTLLKLNDSVIPSWRDLGTSFRNIQILYLNRWEMKTLAGLSCFEFLKELYLSYNEIDDLFDLSYWYNLEIIDLEGNNVSTWDNISYLMGLWQLKDLNLSWNPISKEQNYQFKVKEMLQNLKYLDDMHIGAIEEEKSNEIPIISSKESFIVLDEKYFVLSKFAKFSISIDELELLADQALDWIGEEDDEDTILKKQVKRHERKNEAFEKETFDLFYDCQDSEFENDSEFDNPKLRESKQKMSKSWTNGFIK